MSRSFTTAMHTSSNFNCWFYFVYFSKACGQELC